MANMAVAKFGGTSLGTAHGFGRVQQIISANSRIRVVVASAPGKANGVNRSAVVDHTKITDRLIAIRKSGQPLVEEVRAIEDRFAQMETELGVGNSISQSVAFEIPLLLQKNDDSLVALGENLNAKLLVSYLNQKGMKARFVQPSDICFMVNEQGGRHVIDRSMYDVIGGRVHNQLSQNEILVVPGFYGNDATKAVRVFARGGSDYTGAVIAASLGAEYLNYTDTDGIRVVEPEINGNAMRIPWMTHRELSELTLGGKFGVFQYEAVGPLEERHVRTRVLNTFSESQEGTLIVQEPHANGRSPVAGIVYRGSFTSFEIRKQGSANEVGFLQGVTGLFREMGISIEHMPTSTDHTTVIVKDKEMAGAGFGAEEVKGRISRRTNALNLDSHSINMVAVVGEKMGIGATADVFGVLRDGQIEVQTYIHNGISLILGIKNGAAIQAAGALYQKFFAP